MQMAHILGLMEEIHNTPPCLTASLLQILLFTSTAPPKLNVSTVLLRTIILLALISGNFDWGPCPFHFENSWLQVKDFKQLVNSW